MKRKYLLLSSTIIIYCLLQLLPFFIEGILLLELTASLLPYWIVINIILFFLLLFLFKKHHSKHNPFLILVSSITLFITTLYLFLSFYTFSYIKPFIGTGEKEIKIAFFNKLYSNTQYSEIDKKIKEINPDFLGFSEMKSNDRENIPVLSSYPYWFTKNTRDGATISFYTKFPSTLDNNFPQLKYVLPVNTNINGQEYKFFIIHPLPPLTPSWIQERNLELGSLTKYINSLSEKNSIIMGDFNLSPWSKSFQKLSSDLNIFKNTAQGSGLQFTWHNQYIQTQIDHIFVPNNFQVEAFRSEYIPGSDHNLIFTRVKI